MKVYGYEKNNETMLELNEISICSSISELRKLVAFLENTINSHSSVAEKTEICHSHLRDWDSDWQTDQTDIIIVTKF